VELAVEADAVFIDGGCAEQREGMTASRQKKSIARVVRVLPIPVRQPAYH
jgi:hypothetical protein